PIVPPRCSSPKPQYRTACSPCPVMSGSFPAAFPQPVPAFFFLLPSSETRPLFSPCRLRLVFWARIFAVPAGRHPLWPLKDGPPRHIFPLQLPSYPTPTVQKGHC